MFRSEVAEKHETHIMAAHFSPCHIILGVALELLRCAYSYIRRKVGPKRSLQYSKLWVPT
jgi:hypothetical protein